MPPLIRWLFDTSMGPPGPAGHWPAWLSVFFHGANLVAGFNLAAVPVIIAWHWSYRRDGVRPLVYWRLMSMFLTLSAARLVRFAELNGPPYHLTVLIDAAAALSTAWSVSALPALVRHVMMLPSRAEIHAKNNELNAALLTIRQRAEAVEAENAEIGELLRHTHWLLENQKWTAEKAEVLNGLRGAIAKVKSRGNGDAA